MVVRLGLLEADVLYEDLLEDYCSYGTMFKKALASVNPQLSFRHYNLHKHEFPTELNECDAYLITGSKTGVYDSDAWLPKLADWIKTAHAAQTRLIGICFGHQMLAHSLGGYAAKSNKGWGVGNHMTTVENLPLWLNDATRHFQLIYSHQDQVERLPQNARRLAGSDFCPNAAWFIEDNVLSFQGHPEFSPMYFRRLLERRREHVGNELLDCALDSIDQPNDSDKIIRWILEFIYLPPA